MAASYIELEQQRGKQATVIKAWPSYSSKGTSCWVVTESVKAKAYCTEKLVPGQICKVTGTMTNGNAVFVDPVDLDPGSASDVLIGHEHRIDSAERRLDNVETWDAVIRDVILRVERLEDKEIQ